MAESLPEQARQETSLQAQAARSAALPQVIHREANASQSLGRAPAPAADAAAGAREPAGGRLAPLAPSAHTHGQPPSARDDSAVKPDRPVPVHAAR